MDKHKLYVIQCECTWHAHRVVLTHDYEDLYIDYQLIRPQSFFKRLWLGIKFVLGFGEFKKTFDETMIRLDDVDNIVAFLQEAKRDIEYVNTRSKKLREKLNIKEE